MVSNNTTKLFGLVGYPLGHSFSRKFFNEKFATEKIDASYLNFEMENLDMLHKIIAENPELVGVNVTIPYKEKIIPMLDELDSTAEKIGAVNTVKIFRTADRNKYRMKGYNTDITGFTESIRPSLKHTDRKALVLGSGGASKAIVEGLKEMEVAPTIVSRQSGNEKISYEELTPEIVASHTVIVNSTPLGMWPDIDSFPPIPYHAITPKHVCFDAVYNPSPTTFLKKCREMGAVTIGGLDMLKLQAIAAWKIWNNDTSE